MAKGGEKDGANAKKPARKRHSEVNLNNKEGGSKTEVSKPKKKKVEYVVTLGHSNKMSDRHKGQLACLSSLITAKKTELRATDKKEEILQGDTSSAGLYIEWSKAKESQFMYISSRSQSVVLKLELLAVADLEGVLEEIDVKKPLVVFSEGFGEGGHWDDAKLLLFEMFSKSRADVRLAEDYLYAFTRSVGKIYLRIYKINSLPGADKEGSLKQVMATFVFKPVEMQWPDNADYFVDMQKLIMPQGEHSWTALSSVSVGAINHLQYLGQHNLLLPGPQDLSEWEGFNTNISDYFHRYHAFKRSQVPGSGPEPELVPQFTVNFPEAFYWHLCFPFKVFARSLIICVGNTHRTKACYVNIKEENVFFRGKTVKILGVDLTNYTVQKAISNLNDVGYLIERQLTKMGLQKKNFPADLLAVLRLLKRNPANGTGKKEENPVDDFDIIKNFICWMGGEERYHAIDELVQDFLYRMGHDDQLTVGRQFPTFTQWVQLFDQDNFLLRLSRHHSLPKTKKTEQAMENWHQSKRNELLGLVNHNQNLADKLYSVKEYFKNIHNALKHMLKTMFEKYGLQISPDEIDLVGSSHFAATYAQVQISIPRILAISDPNGRGSFKRFAKFFQHDDEIRFEQKDEK